MDKSGASVQENYRKTTEAVRPCDENERGAHSEKNAGCGNTRENKEREAKPKWLITQGLTILNKIMKWEVAGRSIQRHYITPINGVRFKTYLWPY